MDKHFELDTINMLAATIVDDTIKGAKAGTEKAVMIQTAAYKLAGHIRKPSDDDKSVPERCEEAYNEAVSLIKRYYENTFVSVLHHEVTDFLQKPNPFKEAEIVKDETEPKIYPFDLGLAAQGHKVVTRDGREAKVVCDNLRGTDKPIAAVVTNTDGSKHGFTYYETGRHTGPILEHPLDLFILKEPETIEINIFRNKFDGTYSTSAYESKPLHGEELIKTIKTTI